MQKAKCLRKKGQKDIYFFIKSEKNVNLHIIRKN